MIVSPLALSGTAALRLTDPQVCRVVDLVENGRLYAYFQDHREDATGLDSFVTVQESDGSVSRATRRDPDMLEHLRIDEEGDYEVTRLLTPAEIRAFNVAIWYSTVVVPRIEFVINMVRSRGLMMAQQELAVGVALTTLEVPEVPAFSLAKDFIAQHDGDGSVLPTALGCPDVPWAYRLLLSDETGGDRL